MAYIDGLVVPVPSDRKDAYREKAAEIGRILVGHGAERVVEWWGVDVPHGTLTDFHRAVDAQEGEAIVLAWILWPSKHARDEGHAKAMADPRMQSPPDMPMDMKRMIFGGFELLFDIGATD